jgi:hypothetical protein
MRGKGAIAGCFGLALLTSACNTVDSTYLSEGAGIEVASTDIVASTNLQEIYFGEICRQAGLIVRQTPEGVVLCDDFAMPPAAWTVFVQAGMNDIDRRCDGYLAWLDNRRRWREPILKQLHSTAAATAAILGLSGVGAVPIAAVGVAFGFAQETFVNLSGRLVTEVNHSTVQSLVLTRQNEYRDGLRNRLIPNRPAALYALRSYLRVCMPMTIETEINTTVTSVERNNARPGRMITPATIAGGIITSSRAPLPDFRPPAAEVSKRRDNLLDLALCTNLTGQTRAAAIADYVAGARRPARDTGNTTFLNQAVSVVGDCGQAGYLTAYEVGRYGIASSSARRADLGDLRTLIGDLLGKAVPNTDNLSQLRDVIKDAREKLGLPRSKGEVDAAFLSKLGT